MRARTTAFPLSDGREGNSGGSWYGNLPYKWHDVLRDRLSVVASDIKAENDGFFSHLQSLLLRLTVADDFRQGGDQDSKPAFGLGSQLDSIGE